MALPETPLTRGEVYLDAIANSSSDVPTPLTREETYLAAIATGDASGIPSAPLTRTEQYLDYIAKNGGGGGGPAYGLASVEITPEIVTVTTNAEEVE